MAINASIDEVRRRDRRPEPASRDAGGTDVRAAAEDSVADRVALAWAMDRLPPQLRTAVVLRDHCGLSYQEIAELRDTSADAVRARLARGRRALADLLEIPAARGRRAVRERSGV